jgi:hypothetical protein
LLPGRARFVFRPVRHDRSPLLKSP